MCAAVETPGKCEIRAVIRFLQAEGHSAAEIHRKMSAVYGPNFMSDKCVREWCRKFCDGRTDLHDEGGQGRPSLVTDDLVQHVDKVVRERCQFTISELSLEFPQVCQTVLYEIVTKKLGYHKFYARWVPKMLTDVYKTQRMASALTFLNVITMRGTNFLTRLGQAMKHGLSLPVWIPKNSLDNECTHIHQINPGNSNNHWQTER